MTALTNTHRPQRLVVDVWQAEPDLVGPAAGANTGEAVSAMLLSCAAAAGLQWRSN
jgi:hypothetical protein